VQDFQTQPTFWAGATSGQAISQSASILAGFLCFVAKIIVPCLDRVTFAPLAGAFMVFA
jgi:hypothetical protein